MLSPSARNPTEEPVGKFRLRTAWRSYGSIALSGLTPELSRAAKRRRLGRIVRADVTAEAPEPQAATPRTKREPLTGSRVTRRPRLEKPKRTRRPAEARTLASEGATACTARCNNSRARTRGSTHALGGGASALSEARRPKREKRRATTDQRRPSRTQETQGAMQRPKPTAIESFSPGLTPELSRAAKRRRLEPLVRCQDNRRTI